MKITNLHTIFQNSILTSEPLINSYLVSPVKGCLEDRIAIYANGYYGRIEETLRSDYANLALLLGENKFSKMCASFISAHPSISYSLNFIGKELADFLSNTDPYAKKCYLAEIASFEWAEAQAIIASDAELLTVTQLQALPVNQWLDRKFYLHPSHTILCMNWNSLAFIEAIRNQKKIPKARKLKRPQFVIIWRRQCNVRYCKLTYLDYILLNAIKNKSTFLEICEQLNRKMPENKIPNYLVGELYAWLEEQLLINDDR